jgi:predicted nucleic acid-binding protein
MESFRIFLDTDVLINWLAKEIDPNTGFNLWRCPYEIIELIERRKIEGHASLTNIFEVRFVLRRKKRYGEKKIKECIEGLFRAIEIEVPDSGDMLEANRLQSEQPLDPFDSIGLSIILIKSVILVSRDDDFIKLAKKLNVEAYTPEVFLERYFPNIFERIKDDLRITEEK